MRRRGSIAHEPLPLAPLVEKTDFLRRTILGKIVPTEKLPTPVDEYGIPDRVQLMRNVLGSIAVHHIWSGDYDLHHVAWPRTNYSRYVDFDGERLGINFRNAPSLRVFMPRQLHEYVHAVTNAPPVPGLDTMRQYALEHGQVGRLYDTIKSAKTEEEIEQFGFPREASVQARLDAFHAKIDVMEDGQIGIMPERDYLYDLEIQEARRVLRSIARANGISNSRHSQKAFFAPLRAAA